MDPEAVERMAALVDEENEKILGPFTPEYKEYLKKQKVIDSASIMGPNTQIGKFYWVEDRVSLVSTMVKGYYETRNFEMSKEDVMLAAIPKSGTTWLQMIVLHAIHNCDVEKVKRLKVDIDLPTLEIPECTLATLRALPSPKVIKSHLPYSMLPPGNCNKGYKIVYLARNPKDLAVSQYHFFKMMKGMMFVGDMRAVANLFLNDAALCCPFDQHCLGYWKHRNDGNVLFLTYESLHKDAFNQVKRICQFIGKDFSDDQIRTIVRATCFDEMAANPDALHAQWTEKPYTTPEGFKFMRNGKIGDWKNHFDEEMNKEFDEWIEKRLGHTDLTFEYE